MTDHLVDGAVRSGWCWATMEQLASPEPRSIQSGPFGSSLRHSEFTESGKLVVGIDNVQDGFFSKGAENRISEAKYAELERFAARPGDVLVTVMATIGRSCVVPEDIEPAIITKHIYRVSVNRSFVLPQYVHGCLRGCAVVRQQMFGQVHGQTRPGLNGSIIKGLRLPIPPLPEQRSIVEAVESYLSRLDDAVATLERVERNLKRYRASVLKSAVEGRLVPTEAELAKQEGRDYEPADVLLERILKERRRRWEEAELAKMEAKGKPPKNDKWKAKYKEPAAPDTTNLPELPEGWCWATLDQVTVLVTSGSRGWAKYYSDTGALFIRAQDIKTDSLRIARTARVTPPPGAEGARTSVQFGDVLVTITGANVTKTAFVSAELGEAYVSQHVGLCRPVDADMAAYLHAWIISPSAGRSQLEAAAYGAGKPGLNLDNLKTLVVALPPVAEQTRLLAEVSRLLSVADASSSVVVAAGSRTRRLRQAILKWAFEGKLADQDPNDEPASLLLDRIKAEREAAKPAVKTIRRKGGGKKTIRS